MSGAIVGGIIAGAGAIGGAAIASSGASKAASTQANAADTAAQLQYQASQNALAFQEQQYGNSQAEMAPWLRTGSNALSDLSYLLGVQPANGTYNLNSNLNPNAVGANGGSTNPGGLPTTPQSGAVTAAPGMGVGNLPGNITPNGSTGSVGVPGTGLQAPTASNVTAPGSGVNPSLGGFGSLMGAYPGGQFVAPTAAEAEASPGEQAMLDFGTQAINQSAAAKGSLLTGGTAKALDQYGQQLASTDYQNVYNNAYNTYAQNYNQWNQQQANQYNRLASLAGVGQQTAGQLGTLGQNASNSVASNLLGTAANIGQQYNNAGAANASGYVGAANAWSGALSGGSNNIANTILMQQLMGGGSGMNGSTYGSLMNSGTVSPSTIDMSSLDPTVLSLS